MLREVFQRRFRNGSSSSNIIVTKHHGKLAAYYPSKTDLERMKDIKRSRYHHNPNSTFTLLTKSFISIGFSIKHSISNPGNACLAAS